MKRKASIALLILIVVLHVLILASCAVTKAGIAVVGSDAAITTPSMWGNYMLLLGLAVCAGWFLNKIEKA